MKTTEAIKSIDQQIETLTKQRNALLELSAKLEGLDEDIHVSVCNEHIDFDNPTRTQAVKLMTHLKMGKWRKEVGYSAGKINYIHDGLAPGIKLRMFGAEPPASCRLVEEEVVIPAQPARTEKRMKLVCKEHELQAV